MRRFVRIWGINLRRKRDEFRYLAFMITILVDWWSVWLISGFPLVFQVLYEWIWVPALQFSSVQLLSCARLFVTPWIAARQGSLSITNSQSSFRFTSIESVMPSSHLILCCPLLLLPPIPRSIRVFANESTLHMRWPKYWSFSFSISPSQEHPGLISFRMDSTKLFLSAFLR